ncbi:hypothetical protein PR048_033375 [Dryococelus australis]|uniref:Uncharacterized protein n=1 Tax=Dryococelus australis TaxID=614101 RepID=A0ABQ9G040_9NEOP|nr:hypothetical protein PR048_033375 [Dryococelus australis]
MLLVGGFSQGYPVSPAVALCSWSIPRFARIGSQDLDVKRRPNPFIPLDCTESDIIRCYATLHSTTSLIASDNNVKCRHISVGQYIQYPPKSNWAPVHNVCSVVVTPLESRRATSCGYNSGHPVWHALYECLQDIRGDSSPFLLQPFHELSNGFWPRLTSPYPAIQLVPKMFYRVEVGALGGPVQSANIVVDLPLHKSTTEQQHNERAGRNGRSPRKTRRPAAIVRHDSCTRKSGINPAGNRREPVSHRIRSAKFEELLLSFEGLRSMKDGHTEIGFSYRILHCVPCISCKKPAPLSTDNRRGRTKPLAHGQEPSVYYRKPSRHDNPFAARPSDVGLLRFCTHLKNVLVVYCPSFSRRDSGGHRTFQVKASGTTSGEGSDSSKWEICDCEHQAVKGAAGRLDCWIGCGARLPRGRSGLDPGGFTPGSSHVGIVLDGCFLGVLPFLPTPLHSNAAPSQVGVGDDSGPKPLTHDRVCFDRNVTGRGRALFARPNQRLLSSTCVAGDQGDELLRKQLFPLFAIRQFRKKKQRKTKQSYLRNNGSCRHVNANYGKNNELDLQQPDSPTKQPRHRRKFLIDHLRARKVGSSNREWSINIESVDRDVGTQNVVFGVWLPKSLAVTVRQQCPKPQRIDAKHIYGEVNFAIGSQFIRPALDDSEPITDWQGNTLRIPQLPDAGQQPMITQLRLHKFNFLSGDPAIRQAARECGIHHGDRDNLSIDTSSADRTPARVCVRRVGVPGRRYASRLLQKLQLKAVRDKETVEKCTIRANTALQMSFNVSYTNMSRLARTCSKLIHNVPPGIHCQHVPADLHRFSPFLTERRGSYKGYTGTRYMCAIASTRRVRCSRSAACTYGTFSGNKSVAKFNTGSYRQG